MKTSVIFLSFCICLVMACNPTEDQKQNNTDVDESTKKTEVGVQNFSNPKARELNDKGQIAAKESNFVEAQKLFKEALKLEPNNPVILNNLGFTEHSLDHSNDANQYYLKAIEIDSTYIKTYANYSLFLYENGDYKKAVKIAEYGIQNTEDNEIMGLCFYHATLSLNQLNECAKAKEYYEQFITLFGEDKRFVASYENLKQEMIKCL